MRVSVIIPTRHSDSMPAISCAHSLEQQLREQDEILISVDGAESSEHVVPELAQWARATQRTVIAGPQSGPGATRNRALQHAKGDLILFLNDDVIASTDLVKTHREVHANRSQSNEPDALMLGDAPWAIASDDRIIDRVMRETSWIFFYDQMTDDEPQHDWGYRHAWTLNLSIPRRICEPFCLQLDQPMFDDLEWAFRIQQKHQAKVLYLPRAKVTHHHRYLPRQVFRREILLGHQAAHLHTVHSAVAKDIFNGLYSSPNETDTNLQSINIEKAANDFAHFEQTAMQPAKSLTSDELNEFYTASMSWRTYGRLLGAHGYHNQLSAQQTMDQGLLKCTHSIEQSNYS